MKFFLTSFAGVILFITLTQCEYDIDILKECGNKISARFCDDAEDVLKEIVERLNETIQEQQDNGDQANSLDADSIHIAKGVFMKHGLNYLRGDEICIRNLGEYVKENNDDIMKCFKEILGKVEGNSGEEIAKEKLEKVNTKCKDTDSPCSNNNLFIQETCKGFNMCVDVKGRFWQNS